MNAYIKKIYLFNNDGDYRVVGFNEGLNIITGDSKTGKSAVLEIIDYCLCASTSSIPKGMITNFTDIYCLVLAIQDKFLVIARERPNVVSKRNRGYFSVEYNNLFLNDFSIQYFTSKDSKPIKDIQFEIERHLGISVSNTESEQQKSNKASLRNFMPLLLQHQNLIANKHALFYRFDDMAKRMRTIEEFPVFMGWVDEKYYTIIRSLADKKLKLSASRKIYMKQKELNDALQAPLEDSIKDYFAAIGKKFVHEGKSINELLLMGKNLPNMDLSGFSATEQLTRLRELQKLREDAKVELDRIIIQKQSLEDTFEEAASYGDTISDILVKQSMETLDQEISCPLCHSSVPEITEKILKINESRHQLLQDLAKAGSYKTDNSALYESLQADEEATKRKIRRLSTSIKRLEGMSEEYSKIRDSHAHAMFIKGQIETYIEQLSSEILSTQDIEIENLEKEVEKLEDAIKVYRLEDKYKAANKYLARQMNIICNKLDFEDELKPIDLHFDLRNFSFYHKFGNTNITLSEMGSGANWLACHLSLFLALLSVICRAQNGHIIPLLVIDQPSQVYFPNGNEWNDGNHMDENIVQVTNIFEIIAEAVEHIFKKTNVCPQIIVLEHADNLKLNKYNFESFVRKRWKKDGEKLI